ncbi:MAG: hypothetical protein JWO11_787, partial [Nocardioides sp.]|nr:hypothetical protein [Nocardioides sp.]
MRAFPDRPAGLLGFLLAATLGVSGLAAGPAGAAAPPDSWRVPAQAAIT